jgi:prophage DNA circulation protein
MSWKDNLREGSFRGVKFYIDTSQRTLGRRAVLHEFPNRDTPFTEDLGRLADVFEVEGHVVGDDYFKEKKRLEKVFNKEGPGELIHPYWGARQVQVGVVTISESNREGAIATFKATFYEKGDNRFPKGALDKGALLAESVEGSLDALDQAFQTAFTVANMPAQAVQSARAAVGSFADKVNKVAKIGGAVADGITNLAFATRNLVAEVNDLLQAPDQLVSRLRGSLVLLQGAFDRAEDQFNAMKEMFDFGSDTDPDTAQAPVLGDTPIRDQERANLEALNDYIRTASASLGAESAVVAEYASFNDAEDARDSIVEIFEQILAKDDGTGNPVFQAIADVKAQLVNALPDLDADLPAIKEIKTERDENSLTLCYDLFESLKNEQDIISRNKIRNPGSIIRDTVLEVLDA